jgi:four helix bundle protein
VKDFRTLTVWQKAHQFALAIHSVTKRFPRDERYELTSQLKRAALSIASNIAEGCGRRGDGEFHKFLQNASGSASEAEYQLLYARDLGYIEATEYSLLQHQICEVRRMLSALTVKVDVDRLMQAGSAGRSVAKR